MKLEPAVIFTLQFNLSCQAFRVSAFSQLSADMFNLFILSMSETTSCVSMTIRASNAPPDLNNFHGETFIIHDQTKHLSAYLRTQYERLPQLSLKYAENKNSEFPNGSRTHDLPGSS